jgi:hypothetical protein
MLGIRLPRAPSAVERSVDFLDIERSRIEVLPCPLQYVLVLRMGGVFDGLKEVIVAGKTADVLRRTGAAPRENHREACRRQARVDLLKDNLVLPAVAEVVVVDQPVLGRASSSSSRVAFSSALSIGSNRRFVPLWLGWGSPKPWRWLLVQPITTCRVSCSRSNVTPLST